MVRIPGVVRHPKGTTRPFRPGVRRIAAGAGAFQSRFPWDAGRLACARVSVQDSDSPGPRRAAPGPAWEPFGPSRRLGERARRPAWKTLRTTQAPGRARQATRLESPSAASGGRKNAPGTWSIGPSASSTAPRPLDGPVRARGIRVLHRHPRAPPRRSPKIESAWHPRVPPRQTRRNHAGTGLENPSGHPRPPGRVSTPGVVVHPKGSARDSRRGAHPRCRGTSEGFCTSHPPWCASQVSWEIRRVLHESPAVVPIPGVVGDPKGSARGIRPGTRSRCRGRSEGHHTTVPPGCPPDCRRCRRVSKSFSMGCGATCVCACERARL